MPLLIIATVQYIVLIYSYCHHLYCGAFFNLIGFCFTITFYTDLEKQKNERKYDEN